MDFIIKAFADDIEWEHPQGNVTPWGGNRHGKEETLEFFKVIDENIELIHITPQRCVAISDNEVLVFGSEEALIKRNQRVYNVEWTHLWRFRDGQAVFFKEYTDSAALVDAWLDR